jgi:hypothetical protein
MHHRPSFPIAEARAHDPSGWGERGELEEIVTRARAGMWWLEPEKDKDRVFGNE